MLELVYTSAARRLFEPEQLGKLLEVARRNNAALGVSGILLYEAGSFIQVLEGEQLVVEQLFAKIARDERHDRVKILRQAASNKRHFEAWTMGFVSLDQHVLQAFPRRHGLSSNGSLVDNVADVLELLNGFRQGRFRSYILG